MHSVIVMEPDDKDYRRFMRLIDDYRSRLTFITRAIDNEDLLGKIILTRPSLVFTDICGSGMDCFELIRRVKEEHGIACEFVIVSKYRRFEFAQAAVRMGVSAYLVKPIDPLELQGAILRVLDRNNVTLSGKQTEHSWKRGLLLRNSFMELFAKEEERGPFSIPDLNGRYDLNMREGNFVIAIIVLHGKAHETHGSLLPEMMETIRARFESICYEMIPFVQTNERSILLFNYAPDAALKQRLKDLQGIVTRCLDEWKAETTHYCIGVGKPESTIGRLNDALRSAKRAVCCGFLRGWDRMYYIDEVKFDHVSSDLILTNALIREMRSSIDRLDLEMFRRTIHSALSPVSVYSDPTVVIDIFNVSVTMIDEACAEAGCGEAIEEVNPMHRLGGEMDLQDTISALMRWADTQFERCRQARQNRHPIQLTLAYIDAHYMEPLTLKLIADAVHMNASYLSVLFKKELGVTFSEYLTEFRLKTAKRLLITSNMSISEVCSAVGYKDCKHFSRLFLRAVGTNPSAYRSSPEPSGSGERDRKKDPPDAGE